jgi:hypothetical protein
MDIQDSKEEVGFEGSDDEFMQLFAKNHLYIYKGMFLGKPSTNIMYMCDIKFPISFFEKHYRTINFKHFTKKDFWKYDRKEVKRINDLRISLGGYDAISLRVLSDDKIKSNLAKLLDTVKIFETGSIKEPFTKIQSKNIENILKFKEMYGDLM